MAWKGVDKRKISFILSVITSILLSAPSCIPSPSTSPPGNAFPTGTEMIYETLGKLSNLGGPHYGESAQIKVIPSIQTPLPEGLEWINSNDRDAILAVDYSAYFVIIVFNGYRGGIFSHFAIQRILQNNGTVFIVAHFNDFVPQATSLSAENSQYQVVKINRTQIMQPGLITFRLLDETGKERANAIYEVLK